MVDQFDTDLMSEEEANALKTPPQIDDETGDDIPEKVEKETLPPEGEKKVEGEVKPKEEVKPPEVKPPEEKPPEVKPLSIDGIFAKDGKNIIPFSVLEEERDKRKALEAEIAELKKPKEPVKEPVKEPEKKVEVPPPPPIDFKELGKKLYGSEEGAAEVLETIFEAGRKAGEKAGTTAGQETTIKTRFAEKVAEIKGANPWIKPGFIESTLLNKTIELMDERKIETDDLSGMVKCAEDAVAEGKTLFKIDEQRIDLKGEVEKAAKIGYEKGVKETLAKFNIKEKEEPVTLSDVPNLNPDVLSKFDEIDKKSGIDFEEAYGQLSPNEREAFLTRGSH